MSVTPMATYVADNLYYRINASAVTTKTEDSESTSQTVESNSTSGDRVTFSNDLSIAQTREAIGLNPTGALKLKDLEEVAQDRKESVALILTQTMQSLGIDLNQEISLSMDSEDKIRISGDFQEKSILEEVLNENEEVTTAFKQLSANQSMLDYISQLQHNVQNTTANLADYFKSDTDFNDLLSLADKYESLKSSGNSMGTLLGLSTRQNPYFFTYAPDDNAE